VNWDELKPYEKQQGGYWLYGTDPFGADKRWIPVEAPQDATLRPEGQYNSGSTTHSS
jgi:hypothetical protein